MVISELGPISDLNASKMQTLHGNAVKLCIVLHRRGIGIIIINYFNKLFLIERYLQ